MIEVDISEYPISLFIVAAMVLMITCSSVQAGCSLQFQAYDLGGYAWGESTVRITNGEDVLLDTWSMSGDYYDMNEFDFHGDQLVIELLMQSKDYSTCCQPLIISNELGQPLYCQNVSYGTNAIEEIINILMSCDQIDDTRFRGFEYGKP